MQRRYIESTMIDSIGYDASSSTLEIEFKSGAVWQYYDFPESTWYEFDGAESQGRFFHAYIKGHYRETQVG
mgnify:CR=1 FL=1